MTCLLASMGLQAWLGSNVLALNHPRFKLFSLPTPVSRNAAALSVYNPADSR